MTRFRLRPLSLTLALLAAPLSAQEVVQALPGTTDADALAADMRRIASNPRDVDALVDAARLSLRLEDVRAAAALLQRAENAEPRNPRVKAGQASVLVQSERPGQALRYFAEAEAAGLDPASFAADRGLAYDLTGQQARAQLDYARALRSQPNDPELIRRYALSLGISGQRQRAIAMLDPLVRRSDRAAWRAQAFVLAMTGDIGGASRIAATMMPGGAAGLSAFFERLPTLSPTDRAFAVHFGEVRPTPERLADARLAPPVAPVPTQPVVLASTQPVPVPQADRGRQTRERTRSAATSPIPRRENPQLAATPPVRQPAVTAAATPIRQPVVTASPAASTQRPASPTVSPAPSTPQVLVAAREPSQGLVVGAAPAAAQPSPSTSTPAQVAAPAVQVASTPVQPAPTQPAVQLASATVTPAFAPPETTTALPPAAPADAPAAPIARSVETVTPPPSTPQLAERTIPAARSGAVARVSEDSILARIIAGLSIPGSELGVAEPPRPPAPAIVAQAVSQPAPGRTDTAARAEPAARPEPSPADRAAADKLAAARVAADKRAAERKAAAEKKALAEKKAAAAAKALADKEAAEKKRIERANPERIWVQVAGGAYEGDLAKAYAAVKAKAPGVFGSRGGYTTPLRATNRVLTGPFKSDAEARQFVNDLKKEGVSAFTFTSDAGQPVSRLGTKAKADAAPAKDETATPGSKRRR